MIVAIVALISALLFGGNEMEYYMVTALEKGLKTCIVDKDKKKIVEQQLKQGRKKSDEYFKTRKKNVKQLKEFISNQQTSREKFDSLISSQLKSLNSYQDLVFQIRVNCIKEITEKEWTCIVSLSEKQTNKKKKKSEKDFNQSSFIKVKEAINDHIIDDSKKQLAQEALLSLEKNYTELYKMLLKRNEVDNITIRDYHSSFDNFKTVADNINKHRLQAYNDLVNFHHTMKDIATKEQWNKISKKLIKSLEAEL